MIDSFAAVDFAMPPDAHPGENSDWAWQCKRKQILSIHANEPDQ
jgi:hypothetical protein